MKHILILALFLAASYAAFARLGETERELIKRFGQPISRSNVTMFAQSKIWVLGSGLLFEQDVWKISCTVIDERCVAVSYSKRGEWTDAQIDTVLAANAQGVQWTEIMNGLRQYSRSWRRTDGTMAKWSPNGLWMETPYLQHARDIIEAKAKAEVTSRPKI